MDAADLPARLQARLARGCAAAEARMGASNGASDVIVYRKGDAGQQNEDTGAQSPEWEPVHAGVLPFRLGGTRGAGQTRTVSTPAGDVQVALRTGSFPNEGPDLQDGDLIAIVAGERAGTFWSIVEADAADQQTARRVPVVAAQRPEEWS
ncbi:DUF6093 family protein [Nocardioides campestrisoli]|uniref:DUF6093 family protein n=1 Tax=Nocardioides campestrisoli TaxID=2736757 RepID=UPI0015E72732|nr:DUF6093 family protein [Nocardioides campestrisoli]